MSSLHDEIADIKSSFDGNMDDCEDAKLELDFSCSIIETKPKFEYPHRSGKSRLSVHSSARARSSLGALFLHDLRTCRALIEDVKLKKSGSWHHEIGCSTPDPVDIYWYQ